MTTRHDTLLACGLGVCLLAVQVAIKPRPMEGSPHTAEAVRRNFEWLDRMAPRFELPLRDGSTFRLADHTGRHVVILNFFTTWCAECSTELPDLERYVRQLQLQHKPVVAIAIDGQEQQAAVDRFRRTLNLTLPIGIDNPGDVMRAYEVSKFPTTVVIGTEGRVRLYAPQEIANPDVSFDAVLERELESILRSRPL